MVQLWNRANALCHFSAACHPLHYLNWHVLQPQKPPNAVSKDASVSFCARVFYSQSNHACGPSVSSKRRTRDAMRYLGRVLGSFWVFLVLSKPRVQPPHQTKSILL